MAVATEEIKDLVRRTQKYIGPSVPRIECEAALYAAANELEEWHVAKEDERTINIVQSDDRIVISPEIGNYSLNGISYLAYKDRPMTMKSPTWLDKNDPYWRHSEEGEPLFYFVEKIKESGDTITVRTSRKPAETVTDGYTFVATCKSRPTTIQATNNLIISYYSKYGEVLEFGAAGRMLMQPGRKWSNVNLGKYYLAQFNKVKQDIMAKHRRGDVETSVTVQLIKWV